MDTNIIEKQIELKAPVSKVWKAISDSQQFGLWFRVKFTETFVVDHPIKGMITNPGYEHLEMTVVPKTMEPETLFAFAWHPYAVDTTVDYSNETPTVVQFLLQSEGDGTLLTVKESGFENLPAARRDEAFRMNDGGWTAQIKNLKEYLAAKTKAL